MRKNDLITLGCMALFATNVTAQEQPNVLFIAIDDLNDWVGCMNGHPQAKTPNIDRLASQGVLFTNAHCQAPISGPSRAAIMTGLYPSSSGNYLQLKDSNIKKSNEMTKQATFMPDFFEVYGYKTMAVGKIYHNGDAANTFDIYGGGFSWMGPKPKERINFDPAWMGVPNGTQTDWGVYPGIDSLMTDYKSAEWAVRKLDEKHDKPFFLAVGFVRPHVPWYISKKWFDMFPLTDVKLPPYKTDDFDDIPEIAKRVAAVPMMPTTEWLKERNKWQEPVQAYLACVAFVDHQVGKVLKKLENSEYASNTIVVLWTDHGYHLGEKNRFAKQALWREDTHTPLIIKKPGQHKGATCDAPVQLIDMYPTLLQLCGLPKYEIAEGNSLTPLLENPDKEWNRPALTFYGKGNVAVTGKRYRLIQYENGAQEFYDLKTDPNEWHNLADKQEMQPFINELQKHIPKQWAALSGFSYYNINAYFKAKTKK